MANHKLTDAQVINLDRCYAESDRQQAITRRTEALLAAAGEAPVEMRWYAISVKDGREGEVSTLLNDAGWNGWAPFEQVRSRRPRWPAGAKTVVITRAVFRGYVFALMRWSAASCNWLQATNLRSTGYAVQGIVGGWERPYPIGEQELSDARAFFALSAGERRRVASLRVKEKLGIQIGDRVTIRSGSMAGLTGKVVEADDVVAMWVEILLFGRLVRTQVDIASLDKSD